MSRPNDKQEDLRIGVAVSAVAIALLAFSGVAAAAIALIVGTAVRFVYGFLRRARR